VSDDGAAATEPDDVDRLRRRVLWAMPSGLYVVGSRSGERRNLMTCNWVMQVATTPRLVAVAVETGSLTRELIVGGGSFSVNLLARSDRNLVRRFVKPADEVEVDGAGVATSIRGEAVFEVAGGLPCLSAAVAWLACSVRTVQSWDVTGGNGGASHVLVVGDVVGAGETDRLSAPRGEDDAAAPSRPDVQVPGVPELPDAGRRSIRKVRTPSSMVASASPSMA
jgi:flavin reductase (DIM6/NTAB) family NADH-FMN oxidoreductase RutF